MPTKRTDKPRKLGKPRVGRASSSFAGSHHVGTRTNFHKKVRHDVPTIRSGFSTSYTGEGTPAPTDSAGFSPEAVLTRRNLLIGAGVLGGVALIGGAGSIALDKIEGDSQDVNYITVPEEAVMGVDQLEEVSSKNYLTKSNVVHLPYGSLVWADNSTYAACLVPNKSARPLNTVRILGLASGNSTTVLDKAQGHGDGFDIVDVRCSSKGMIWVEANIFENLWRVYTAKLSDGELKDINLVEEGDDTWLTPSIAAVGKRAFWQMVPDPNGEAAAERSLCKSALFGVVQGEEVYSSKRAFATRISTVKGGVVITPRAESTGTYYQLTMLDSKDAAVQDQMTLPASMAPDQASYGRSGFSFAFTNTYNYGGGIAGLGTYTPTTKADPESTETPGSWFRFGRTPSATPSWVGDWFCVKSTRAISCIHFAKKKFFSITPSSDADNWGEYLASTGNCEHLVGLSQVTPASGKDPYTLVRVYDLDSGDLGSAFA